MRQPFNASLGKYYSRVSEQQPAPLTAAEEALLRALMRATLVVPRALDTDLLREQGLQLTEYFALMHLSEQQGRRLRMSDLAAAADLSLSGMTRVVGRLEAQGLVRRERCPEDARGWNAVLTDTGLDRLRRAWPAHLASVRRHVVDRVDPGLLGALAQALLALVPGATCPGSAGPGQPAATAADRPTSAFR